MSIDRKKIFLIIGASFILLLLILISATISLKSKTKPSSVTPSVAPPSLQEQTFNQTLITPTISPSMAPILPYPKAEFASWSQAPSPSYLPTSAAVYTFKQTYTQDDVQSLAKKLSLSGTMEQNNDNLFISEVDEANNQLSTLIFNTKTNNFAYLSAKGISLPTTPKTAQEKVSLFLKSLFFDPTLSVTASYKKKDKPDITYYEIHRDWQKAGLPILNNIGLLNLPEDQPLSTLSLTGKTADIPEDANIYQSSDNKDGLARQTDFNTITIGVKDKEEKIISLSSNLRQLQTNKLSLIFLASFDQAYQRLKNNQYQSLLTAPSGKGATSFDKVYLDNKAIAKNAVISESLVAYLEKPATVSQSTLEPYYLFRGYAQLDSGYRVNFIASVPAVETKANSQVVLGETYNATQQQDDLSFPTITPTAIPTPTLQPTTPPSSNCVPSVSDLTNIREINGVKVGEIGGGIGGARGGLYYIPQGDCNTAECLTQVLNALQNDITGLRNINRILAEFSRGTTCPIRITGGSPSIFIYGKKDSQIVITSKAILTYSDPAIDDNNLWKVQV